MNQRTALLLAFIALKFLLQYFLIIPEYELHRDEYLHLDQANHLAWGYLSVPPATSLIGWIIQALGNGEWAVRFFPALFGALTLLVVWKAVERLGGNLYACVLAGSCVVFSVLLRLNQLFQPNSLDVLCWTSLYFFLIGYIQSRSVRWLYGFAVVFAVGFLNKYNIAFAVIGLLPAILVSSQRTLLLNRHVYFALLAALVLISPNLIWQYQNGFPVIHHMHLLAKTQLVNVSRADFLKEQLLHFMGALAVIVAGLYGLLVYRPLVPYRLFFFSMVITLCLFVYLRAKGYYAIGIYPIYIAFGAVFVGAKVNAAWVRALFVLIPVVLFIPLFQVAFPNKTPEQIIADPEPYRKLGMLRWEDGKDHQLPQDFADMVGWRELAGKVDKAYAAMPDDNLTLVLCDNYGQAGAINYYTQMGVRAVTFNADYINWFDLTKNYKHLIRVKTWGDEGDEMQETGPLFASGFKSDSVTNLFSREWGTAVYVFKDAKADFRGRLEKEIEAERW
ncbi:hypothetical protein GCM10010967_43660 [Dyadobacter beijingensis]|uniref:Glycosyltransferase RgtA/B/C/D-like domain-containing protein n=1 Tax=Dyadobacter beijingensis TaxID=365489 RepID=A0ABQ2I8Z1_9BACT|nr:glycosyltransferase family 39 protein [Dyadobacter beijingensis]GGN04047.1 hypothetical protein GCM10010967_43660 [Dyadobacter beijingensis]